MKKKLKRTSASLAAAAMAVSMLSAAPYCSTFNLAENSITANAADDSAGIAIDETNFPDANFRDYVLQNCDKNGDTAT